MFKIPLWALRFYRDHWPVVLGLSMIGAVERFTGQLWDRSEGIGLACELITLAERVVLVGYAVWIGAREGSWHGWWRRVPWMQFVLINVAFVLFDVVPENLVPALVETGPLYLAFLLGIKNLTVIPFTMLWLVGIIRTLRGARPAAPQPHPDVPREAGARLR